MEVPGRCRHEGLLSLGPPSPAPVLLPWPPPCTSQLELRNKAPPGGFLPSPGVWTPESQVQAGGFLPRPLSSAGGQLPPPGVHLCACVLVSACKNARPIELGATPGASF